MTSNVELGELDRLRFENAQLAAAIRSLELQLFALYAERDTARQTDLVTTYENTLNKELTNTP